jgi:hypothetical protein
MLPFPKKVLKLYLWLSVYNKMTEQINCPGIWQSFIDSGKLNVVDFASLCHVGPMFHNSYFSGYSENIWQEATSEKNDHFYIWDNNLACQEDMANWERMKQLMALGPQ